MQESGVQIQPMRKVTPEYLVKSNVFGERTLKIGLSKPLLRSSFLSHHKIGYDEALKISEDYWFYFDCLIQGARFLLLAEAYYFYRAHQNSSIHTTKVTEYLDLQIFKCSTYLKNSNFVRQHPIISAALAEQLEHIRKMRIYNGVVLALKEGKILQGMIKSLKQPYFYLCLFTRLKGILNRRFQYHVLGNREAFEIAIFD
jgi:succinoglycan biosynthesis protein ExoO